eukprot:13551103-Alexandrium_andersonii.AAC.1
MELVFAGPVSTQCTAKSAYCIAEHKGVKFYVSSDGVKTLTDNNFVVAWSVPVAGRGKLVTAKFELKDIAVG